MDYVVRNFQTEDAQSVNRIAACAFAEFLPHYSDASTFEERIGNMAALVSVGEIIVAANDTTILGAVAYIPSHSPKSEFFRQRWAIIRMLVVDPDYRGIGVGRALSEECIQRAGRDGAREIALHTSPIMKVALPMYERMGFEFQHEAPPIFGVPYNVYLKRLDV